MGLLGKILLNEGITIFRCDILIKTALGYSQDNAARKAAIHYIQKNIK